MWAATPMSRLAAAFTLLLTFACFAAAQTPAAQSSPPDAQTTRLEAIMEVQEPGRQMRELEAFATQFPHSSLLPDVYNAVIQDAVALNDDAVILHYNLKLQQLDPGNLAQRVKVLNLLLLETDTVHKQQAATAAAAFAKMVEEKTAEAPPEAMGPTRWRLDMARLRSLADLFQGAAAQALGSYSSAEQFLASSLQQSETEEAAQHLGQVYVAEGKIPQALNAYALALALPGQTIAQRAALESTAAALYRTLHNGSRVGFGDLILRQFDSVASRDAAQQSSLHPHAGVNAAASTLGQFVLTSLDGARHTLAAERGKVVVLDFWATWCGPCRVQHPLLVALAKEFASNHNVIFVAVNEDEVRSRVAPFLTAHDWAQTTWLDAGLGPFLGVDSLPTTMILNPQGAIVYRQSGFVPSEYEANLRAAIERTLKASPAS
ncbi:MAG: TlpA family protein disulfide reductase [Terriglobales bacterium]